MDEAAAREVILVRAVETADAGRTVWRDEDRAWASSAAASVVGAGAPVDAFVSRRAALALERLSGRHRALERALRATTWRPWVGALAVAAAFVLGLAADQIGPAKRVNILAFPLLAIVAWNLLVYVAIVLRGAAGLAVPAARALGPIARNLARFGRAIGPRSTGVAGDPIAGAVGRFMHDWAHASAGLVAARVGNVLHLAAIALALGAVAGLYLRGLVLEYRASWESTFLGADAVHRALAFVLAPASAITGIAVPDAAALAEIAGGPGVNAAPWIHLYAATIAIFVLVPRALLALGTGLAARRLERRFPLALDDAYSQRLARQVSGEAARVSVVPYGHQPSPQAALALQSIVGRVFGPHALLSIAPGVEWGGEDALPASVLPTGPLALVVPLFSLVSTPEAENHGAFLAALRERLGPGTALVAFVDESSFRKRFAQQPARLEERRGAWREALSAAGVQPLLLDLDQPDPASVESALAAAIEQGNAAGARP
jgi:hypothetical protein